MKEVMTKVLGELQAGFVGNAMQILREALAEQPAQQEPVAWMDDDGNLHREEPPYKYGPDPRPLVFADTSPSAQRTWVGLTDDEFEDIELGCRSTPFGKIEAMKKVEAKLRSKNT